MRSGHLWVFSNELDTGRSPLKGLEPGQTVLLKSHDGRLMGSGYANPQSLIALRLMHRKDHYDSDPHLLLRRRLSEALSLREALFPGPYYRWVHGEGDHLPGLIVDRYGDTLVAEITTAGMQRQADVLAKLLRELSGCRCLIWRNDVGVRELEGLPLSVDIAFGEPPQWLQAEEQLARFEVPATTAQKTGWFYDQQFNRSRMKPYVQGRRVLDMFSYAGGWGVSAMKAGAESALCVDASEKALEWAERNAAINNVEISSHCDDAFAALKSLRDSGEKFGAIVVDPPALIPKRKDHKNGMAAYQRLNELAMHCLEPGGFLIACSCSHHLSEHDLVQVLRRAAIGAGRRLQMLEQGGAGPDHPIHPAMPETAYLKAWYCRVS